MIIQNASDLSVNLRRKHPLFEPQLQEVTYEYLKVLEEELEKLKRDILNNQLSHHEVQRLEYGYLGIHCLMLGVRILDSCRLTIEAEEERDIYRLTTVAAGVTYYHVPNANLVPLSLFELLRPTEDAAATLGLCEPREIGNLWEALMLSARAYNVKPPEDEVRDLLMPDALLDHDVMFPPTEFLCQGPLVADVALFTEQRDTNPSTYLLGLVLNHLLQLSKLPYADVVRLYDAAGALVATQSLSYDEQQLYKRLSQKAQDITGPIKTTYFRPGVTLSQDSRRSAYEYAFDMLRHLKAYHSEFGNLVDEARREQIWHTFERLDHLLEQTHPLNQVITWTIGLKALLLFQRAPGMPVSTEAELGHALTELPTHFAWREVRYASNHELVCSLSIIEDLSIILRELSQGTVIERETGTPPANINEEQFQRLTELLQEAALETGAIFRSLNISHHGHLLKMLTPEGNLSRITPLWTLKKADEYTLKLRDLKAEIEAVLETQRKSVVISSEPSEEQGPNEPTAPDALKPATPKEESADPGRELRVTPEILKVREWAQGGHILMIGGEILEHHHRNLEQAFGATVEWIPTDRYEHGQQAAVRLRPGETRFAIVAIRWVSHAQSELRLACKNLGIPCVMHPAGLNPVSIAYHTVSQIGRQLSEAG